MICLMTPLSHMFVMKTILRIWRCLSSLAETHIECMTRDNRLAVNAMFVFKAESVVDLLLNCLSADPNVS